MSTSKRIVVEKTTTVNTKEVNVLFTKDNYKWMLIGLVVIALGMILMAGGKSPDPNVFNESEIYGFRRITLAPILIIAGLVIEVYAIMKRQT